MASAEFSATKPHLEVVPTASANIMRIHLLRYTVTTNGQYIEAVRPHHLDAIHHVYSQHANLQRVLRETMDEKDTWLGANTQACSVVGAGRVARLIFKRIFWVFSSHYTAWTFLTLRLT